ncbi:hypothetical protein [Cerasicoccus frondis]|uniref:hypothetical protein n=1 Tax=Cerasicoccus frondis TaxID=490090 RepID=UPI0028526528|nr:hypothetical protein [Cerasicoccus frondis]
MRSRLKKNRPFGMPNTPFDPRTGKYLTLGPDNGESLLVSVGAKQSDSTGLLYTCYVVNESGAVTTSTVDVYHLTTNIEGELAIGSLTIAHRIDGKWWMQVGDSTSGDVRFGVVHEDTSSSSEVYYVDVYGSDFESLYEDPISQGVIAVHDDGNYHYGKGELIALASRNGEYIVQKLHSSSLKNDIPSGAVGVAIRGIQLSSQFHPLGPFIDYVDFLSHGIDAFSSQKLLEVSIGEGAVLEIQGSANYQVMSFPNLNNELSGVFGYYSDLIESSDLLKHPDHEGFDDGFGDFGPIYPSLGGSIRYCYFVTGHLPGVDVYYWNDRNNWNLTKPDLSD